MDIRQRHNVRSEGAGEIDLVLAHGLGTDQRLWRELAPRLTDGHRVTLFDYLGSGGADRSAFDLGRYRELEAYAEDLIALVRELRLIRPVIVGYSVSGAISLLASVAAPQLFAGIVCVASSPRYLNDPETSYVGGFSRPDLDAFFELMDRNFVGWARAFSAAAAPQPDVARSLEESFMAADPRALRAFAQATFACDVRSVLSKIRAPTLILQCADDVIAPISAGHFLRDHLPDARMVVLDAPGHVPVVTHPDDVADNVRTFVEARVRVGS